MGKENSGGDIIIFGKHCYAEGFGIYKQTNRKGWKKI